MLSLDICSNKYFSVTGIAKKTVNMAVERMKVIFQHLHGRDFNYNSVSFINCVEKQCHFAFSQSVYY